MPDGVRTIAFTDDLAVVTVVHTPELSEDLVNTILETIDQWIRSNELSLAQEKSKCILLTNKKKFRNLSFKISETSVPEKRVIRYLGVRNLELVSAGVKNAAMALAADAKRGRPEAEQKTTFDEHGT